MIDLHTLKDYIDTVFDSKPSKLVFSKPAAGCEYRKMVLQKKQNGYQLEKYTQKQAFHENLNENAARERTTQILSVMNALNAFCEENEYSLLISKKGKISFSKRKSENTVKSELSHNRQKNYILQSSEDIPALIDMGVFTKEGRVVASMQDKYRQINRFVELIDDAFKGREPSDKPLRIIDFGCGKSYLTFILYHYFTKIKKMRVQMTGLDLKQDVIEKCNLAAEKYGYTDLHFELGDIKDYSCDEVDMVITLHACDTATDYALYNAISWGAKMIFSVPCCQHELNAQMKTDRLSLLTRYGIVKERTAALITDSIRANLLEYRGYKTQLLEFVDFGATPKNILIRAIKREKPLPEKQREKYRAEVESVIEEFGLSQTLYELTMHSSKE